MTSYMHEMSQLLRRPQTEKTKKMTTVRLWQNGRQRLIWMAVAACALAVASGVRSKSSSRSALFALNRPGRPANHDSESLHSEIVWTFWNDYVALDPFYSPKRKRSRKAVLALQDSSTRLKKALKIRPSGNPALALRTDEFLAAVDAVMPAFEALGAALHAAAIKDVLGNANKLRRNGAPKRSLRDLVVADYEALNHAHPDSSAQATLWLARILDFISDFFKQLSERQTDTLSECLARSYESTVGLHHNLLMRSVAFALMQIIPDRSAMVDCFELDSFDALRPFLLQWAAAADPVVRKLKRFLEVDIPQLYPPPTQLDQEHYNLFLPAPAPS